MLLLAALVACSSAPDAPPPPPEGLHGLSIGLLTAELESRRERPRIYNFWATWCGPCMAEMPTLRAFGERHRHVDLIFVNVDQPSIREQKVEPTIRRMKLEGFEHLALDDADPAYALNSLSGWPNSIPVTMVVSSRGERVRQYNTRVTDAILTKAIDQLD